MQSPSAHSGARCKSEIPSQEPGVSKRRERWGVSYVTIPAESAEEFAPVVERLAGR